MRKKVLATALCAVMSLSLGLGSVMVGASQTGDSIDTTSKKVEAVASIENKQLETKKAKKAGRLSATPQTVTPTYVSTVAQFNSFLTKPVVQGSYGGTTANSGYVTVGYVKPSVSGTLVLYAEAALNGSSASVRLTDAAGNYKASSSNVMMVANLSANQTYTMQVYASKGQSITAEYTSAMVSSANNRTITSGGIATASTGAYNYQNFTMKKTGIVKLAIQRVTAINSGIYGASYSLQKKSGSKWVNIATNEYSSSDKYTVYGLSKGSYRVAMNASAGALLFPQASMNYYSTSYGKKKSKAKVISRKKNKKNTLLYADKAGKAHWYKIKVTKKRSTKVEIKGLGTNGSISVIAYGKGLKSKRSSDGNKITYYGKLKKGTYYFKVYKASKSSSGAYQIKYVK